MKLKLWHNKSKGFSRIHVCYSMLGIGRNRTKSKTFKVENIKEAMDWALKLDDSWLASVDEDIWNWLVENKHPLLRAGRFD
jgi:hypothetical protein